MIRLSKLSMVIIGMLLNISLLQAADFKPLPGQKALRVCADAFNLPYSNDKFEGFDNKIADIIAEELGIPVEYYWFPQRIGFARNTIKKEDPNTGEFYCDVAMSIPAERGIYLPTEPYFSSIETMVYRKGEGYELNEISDIAKVSKENKKLRIGLFDRAIATEKLLELGLSDQIEYYQMMAGDAKVIPGRLIEEELASGRVDVAFAWGPIAGYFAKKSPVDMTVVPLNEFGEDFVFSFGLGVRPQDVEWRDLLNKILEKRKDDIQAVLADYNFPSLANVKPSQHNKKQAYTVVDGKVDEKTYVGWRVFNTSCYVCHGQDAKGTDIAPNLVERVADLSEFKFRKKLLKRYFAKVNLDDPNRRQEFLSQLSESEAAKFKMPTWSDEPYIRSHIGELYAYLKARADGALAEGEPARMK
jgi:quinoprotein dehydrogenase-associated probable ABC transporter substrate-binding protein